jgi:hypothetical protein
MTIAKSRISSSDPLSFYEKKLEDIAKHKMYTFEDGYKGYHQVKIALEDQLKITFTTPWGTFCYTLIFLVCVMV